MTDTNEYCSFASWTDVLLHVRKALPIYYQAPLDLQPVRVTATIWRKRVRVQPPSAADLFVADAAHLSRFRFKVPATATRRATTGFDTIRERFPAAYILWSVPVVQGGEILAISIRATVLLVHEYHDGHGWQVYAPVVESGRIDVTLDAIDARTQCIEYDYLAKDRP